MPSDSGGQTVESCKCCHQYDAVLVADALSCCSNTCTCHHYCGKSPKTTAGLPARASNCSIAGHKHGSAGALGCDCLAALCTCRAFMKMLQCACPCMHMMTAKSATPTAETDVDIAVLDAQLLQALSLHCTKSRVPQLHSR